MEVKVPYTEETEFLRRYKQDSGKTQSAIAKELDVSESALSSFLSGTYKTPQTIAAKVRELMRMREKKKTAPREPEYAETGITKKVTNAIRYSHIQGRIAVVYGDAGVGKTMAVRHYLEENSLAVGITISPTYASITGVNELLAERLGVRERVARRITVEIVNKLRGSGRVIVIDEAQHLTVRAMDHLRCISDESGVGITFVGNEGVYTKMRGSHQAEFAQLYSRIGMRRQVLVQNIRQEDVIKIFGRYEMGEDAISLLYKICQTSYGLRGAVNVYINTAAVFEAVTAGGIVQVMRDMNIGA